MWVMTQFGFFSIVAHRTIPGSVLVRSRSHSDLLAFAVKLDPSPEIKATPRADYAFRLTATKGEVANVLLAATHEIDYDNFKNRVAETQGYERAGVYCEVWSTLREIQKTT